MARRITLYALYVLVLVGLIAAIIVAFRSNDNKPASKDKTATTQQQQQAAQQKKQGGQTATNTPGSATQQSNPSYSAPTSSNTAGKGGTTNLTNTGPGEVMALFAVTVAGGTVYYSLRQRKQLV